MLFVECANDLIFVPSVSPNFSEVIVLIIIIDLDVIRENLEAMSVYVRSPAPNNQSAYSSSTGTANFPHASSTTELKQVRE